MRSSPSINDDRFWVIRYARFPSNKQVTLSGYTSRFRPKMPKNKLSREHLKEFFSGLKMAQPNGAKYVSEIEFQLQC